jgi:hypothetical protein
LLLLRVVARKRGANEAVGAGWLLCRWFCAPAPSALFAAVLNLLSAAKSNEK